MCVVFVYPFSYSIQTPRSHTSTNYTTQANTEENMWNESKSRLSFEWMKIWKIFARKIVWPFFCLCVRHPLHIVDLFQFFFFWFFFHCSKKVECGLWTLEMYIKVLNNKKLGWMKIYCTHHMWNIIILSCLTETKSQVWLRMRNSCYISFCRPKSNHKLENKIWAVAIYSESKWLLKT